MQFWHWITYPFRSGPRRPLAMRQPKLDAPEKTPLGLEAVDMGLIESVNRRNAALERVNTFVAPNRKYGSFAERAETRITPLPDDETYAERYYRAYSQKGS
jgi:hypothetical protein